MTKPWQIGVKQIINSFMIIPLLEVLLLVKKADILKYLGKAGVSPEYYDGISWKELQALYKDVKKIKETYKKVLKWNNVGPEINKILKRGIDIPSLGSRLRQRLEKFPDQYQKGIK